MQLKQNEHIALLQGQVTDLQSDNVKLYEKIRFLQGYSQKERSSNDAVVESKYRTHYEQKLDPFSTFSNQVFN